MRPLFRLALAGLAAAAAACDSPSESSHGAAAAVQIVSGDLQPAVVGQPAGAPLVVKVVDSRGRAVPGWPVTFSVTAGNGSVSPASATTDAEGLAQATWTLGTTAADTQRVAARADDAGGSPVPAAVFRAVPVAGAPVALTQVNNLAGAPGATLTPRVRVMDSYGNGVAGATVRWTAIDGSLSAPQSVADANGEAQVQWTLGTFRGTQFLDVAVGSLPTLHLKGQATTNTVFSVQRPAATDSVLPSAGVGPVPSGWGPDQYFLVSASASRVTVRLASRSADLVKTSGSSWSGSLNLDGVTPGPYTLDLWAVSGTDSTRIRRAVTVNQMPRVTITAPVSLSGPPTDPMIGPIPPTVNLASTSLHVAASCTDDTPGGCVTMTVYGVRDIDVGPSVKLFEVAAGSLDTTIDLGPIATQFNSKTFVISVAGTDAMGRAGANRFYVKIP